MLNYATAYSKLSFPKTIKVFLGNLWNDIFTYWISSVPSSTRCVLKIANTYSIHKLKYLEVLLCKIPLKFNYFRTTPFQHDQVKQPYVVYVFQIVLELLQFITLFNSNNYCLNPLTPRSNL